jgi:hypothetical protein
MRACVTGEASLGSASAESGMAPAGALPNDRKRPSPVVVPTRTKAIFLKRKHRCRIFFSGLFRKELRDGGLSLQRAFGENDSP